MSICNQFIVILSLSVAKRVLEKEEHRIGKIILEVAPFTERTTENQSKKFSGKTTADNDVASDIARTVEIHGEIGNISEESLKLYLENKRRSGGGPIEKINLKVSPGLVTFEKITGKKLTNLLGQLNP